MCHLVAKSNFDLFFKVGFLSKLTVLFFSNLLCTSERSCSRSPVRRSRSQSPKKEKADRPRPFMGGRRVVVRNIPYEVRWQELKDMFRKDSEYL